MEAENPLDPLLEALASNDDETALSELSLLPLDTLDTRPLYTLLGTLLEAAVPYERMTRLVMDEFARSNPTEDKISTFSQLFVHPQISVPLLREVAAHLPEYTHDEVVIELMDFDNNPILPLALTRLARVYGERGYVEAELLYRRATDKDATQIADFYFKVLREQAPFTDVPAWVKAPPKGHTLKTHTQLVDEATRLMTAHGTPHRPSDAALAARLIKSLEAQGTTLSNAALAKQILQSQLAIATPADRAAFLAPLGEIEERKIEGEENREVFRRVGPVNLLNGTTLLGDDVCARLGGCRMLTCNCFERDASRAGISFHTLTDDPSDEDAIDEDTLRRADWFLLQSCQTCGNRIRCRAHALRRPLTGGGWRGCYCSIGCLKASYSKEEQTNGLTYLMVNRILNQIEAIRILDRIEPERPRPEIDDEDELVATALVAQRPRRPLIVSSNLSFSKTLPPDLPTLDAFQASETGRPSWL